MPSPVIDTHCSTCHRTERWAPDGTQVVVMEGGRRRPAEPVYRATWATLRDWKTGGAAVVGTCDCCAQPMVSTTPGATPVTGWTLTLPKHTITIGEWLSITPTDGTPERVTIDAVDALVGTRNTAQSVRSFIGPLSTLPFLAFTGTLVLMMVLLWLFTGSFFLNFIWQGFNSGGFVGPNF